MSTSDQHQHGQLTRKQLREARLTGSTPIVTPEDAEAARAAAEAERAAPAAPEHAADVATADLPAAEEPRPEPEADAAVETSPEPASEPEDEAEADEDPESEHVAEPDSGRVVEGPLTRRQMREQERIRTASVPVLDEHAPAEPERAVAAPSIPERPELPPIPAPAAAAASAPGAPPAVEPAAGATQDADARPAMITDVPRPTYPTRRRSFEPADEDEQDGVDDAEQSVAPVSVSAVMRAEQEAGRARRAEPAADTAEHAAPASPAAPAAPLVPDAPVAAPLAEHAQGQSLPFAPEAAPWTEPAPAEGPSIESLLSGSEPVPAGEPTVSPGFGQSVLAQQPETPASDSFDALIGDSAGSHHGAPNALIFQTTPAGPSLSGPVASTGEILVTGSYDLPAGLGSRGHADGFADGKEVDVVLVDGELAPASSPTPIAASAAIGTIKPAGEVIRPPEPEKSNKLMLALTITAGALAVALVGALIVAITTGALS
ncbi:hypothetical protein [Microbacterium sp. 22242]|uniref:hypothetical protein n=1 Tax=Microbacterium sp. 22242 TaxID=3453896 RepID=UPI003F82B37A